MSLYNIYLNGITSEFGPNKAVTEHYLRNPTAFKETDFFGNTQLHHYFRYGKRFEDRRLKKQFLTTGNLFTVNYDGKFCEDCQGVNEGLGDEDAINLQRLRNLAKITKKEGSWFIYP